MSTTLAPQPTAAAMPRPTRPAEADLRHYIYCIADCDEPKRFDCDSIGNDSQDVHAVVHNGVAAIISTTCKEKYTIDRRHLLAHQRVMEHVMEQGHTVLPVKFDTIAGAKNGIGPEKRIIQQVLMKRSGEFSALLDTMRTRAEMGVKALWRDMNTIFREIVNSNEEIKRLRDNLAHRGVQTVKTANQSGRKQGPLFSTRMKLGELVKNALDTKREREQQALIAAIRGIVADFRKNKTFGDQMFANLALLVEKSQVEALDRKLNELADAAPARTRLKYVGPVPPSNFIELVIRWDE